MVSFRSFLPSIRLHRVAWSLDTLYFTISMLMIARCMFLFESGDYAVALNGLQLFLVSIRSCISTNRLRLNPHKLNSSFLGTSKYLSIYFLLSFLGVKTNPEKSARNLGEIFDKNFTFHSHISAVCSSCFYHIWDLWGYLPLSLSG